QLRDPTIDLPRDVVHAGLTEGCANGLSTQWPVVRVGLCAPSGANGCGVVDGLESAATGVTGASHSSESPGNSRFLWELAQSFVPRRPAATRNDTVPGSKLAHLPAHCPQVHPRSSGVTFRPPSNPY